MTFSYEAQRSQHRETKFSGRVVVIGTGRFGNALAQGIRDSYIHLSDGQMIIPDVQHVSCGRFLSLSKRDIAFFLSNTDYICYTGIFLPKYAKKLADGMQLAAHANMNAPLEFIDCKYRKKVSKLFTYYVGWSDTQLFFSFFSL